MPFDPTPLNLAPSLIQLPLICADQCREYQAIGEELKRLEARRDVLRKNFLTAIGDAPGAICGPYRISVQPVAGTPDKLITPAMVGETIKGRAGSKRLVISA